MEQRPSGKADYL